jgi:hypothetical protein
VQSRLLPHCGHSQYPPGAAQLVENSIFAKEPPPVIFIGGKIWPDPDEIWKAGWVSNHLR